jgi:hypothetical protein
LESLIPAAPVGTMISMVFSGFHVCAPASLPNIAKLPTANATSKYAQE